MARSKIYYDIFETESHYEFHSNPDKKLVEQRQSMARRITKNSPRAAEFLMLCIDEVNLLQLVRCKSYTN